MFEDSKADTMNLLLLLGNVILALIWIVNAPPLKAIIPVSTVSELLNVTPSSPVFVYSNEVILPLESAVTCGWPATSVYFVIPSSTSSGSYVESVLI